MARKIFFDLDNTLLDFNKSERAAITETLLHFDISPREDILKLYSSLNLAQWKLLEAGLTTRSQLKVKRFENLFDELGAAVCAADAAKYYEARLSRGHFFIDGAQELLQSLSKIAALYLVTNGSAIVQRGRLKSAGIEKYFDMIFISEEIGFNKPDAAFFDVCFSRIVDFDKSSAVIIGDSLSSDIQGGINAGIQTVWFNPKSEKNLSAIRPDYEISRLSEFLSVMENL